MSSMQWQLGMLGTITAFAYRHRETKKNLCRGGQSQDLPNTDFQPFYYHVLILIELYFNNFNYFSNFGPLTFFCVTIPETA